MPNIELAVIDIKKVVEVIGRLQGRAVSHLNSANQTQNIGKKEAHLSAHDDLISLANDLSSALNNPELAQSNTAYWWSVNK